jgi:hypothetical protein
VKVLTSEQIDQFVADGFVVLPAAFPSRVAAEIRDLVWKGIGLSPDRPDEWTKPLVHYKQAIGGPVVAQAFTPRLYGALDDVMGEERWNRVSTLGWWPVAFPGFDSPPWQEPATGWHVDGQQFHHHINSPDQGLLPIFLLSDIGPGDGGTALSLGSHAVTARALLDSEPDGMDVHTLAQTVAAAPRERVIEVTGNAGDVALIHPFVLHARSPNTGSKVRFICNPCYTLKEPMQFDRPDPADQSPVERAIINALASDRRNGTS